MIEDINSGYFVLALVGVVFVGLLFWWIGMTIRNGRKDRPITNQNKLDEIKKSLERTFLNDD